MTASATPEVPTRPSGPPRRYQMYIAGEWVDAHSGETFETIDPFTGEPWAVIPRAGRGWTSTTPCAPPAGRSTTGRGGGRPPLSAGG